MALHGVTWYLHLVFTSGIYIWYFAVSSCNQKDILERAWSANFKLVCPPATSEAGARRPRSSSNYGVLFTFLIQTIKTRTLTHIKIATITTT
jgi:hypothetical protein